MSSCDFTEQISIDTWKSSFVDEESIHLDKISFLDLQLTQYFEEKFLTKPSLTRQLVSFQANKDRAIYRWYKYKEAFSACLVEHLLNHYGIKSGKLLDPFAGSGTALFAASALGMDADGIELLPIGQEIIKTRLCIQKEITADDLDTLNHWVKSCPWQKSKLRQSLLQLRITQGAYPTITLDSIEKYMEAWQTENERVQAVLKFALLCVLESLSYTRKDGQYLRWDYRSTWNQGSKSFNKGEIPGFDQAICQKLSEILADLHMDGEQKELFSNTSRSGNISLFSGSSLDILPTLASASYDVVITSPPYCNRYDYTRAYALELALLGVGQQEIVSLRQQMLSCTVENRTKDLLGINSQWSGAIEAADRQELLQAVLRYLEMQKEQNKLNNNGIPRMVRGYFYEMACIIAECSRLMKPNSLLFMVNDNVRYVGASISVDMILSNIAERLGFQIESILVLPKGKGNSSQQMGRHGRDSLRKCVYVWKKI